MRIAVGTAWVMTGITFAAAAGITLTVAWFILDYFQDSKFEIRQQDEFALLVCRLKFLCSKNSKLLNWYALFHQLTIFIKNQSFAKFTIISKTLST